MQSISNETLDDLEYALEEAIREAEDWLQCAADLAKAGFNIDGTASVMTLFAKTLTRLRAERAAVSL